MKRKLPSIRNLHKRAWTLWSIYQRKKSADWQGNSYCYTCLAIHPWQDLQLGHFIHGKLDFDERNVKPQCPRCNLWLSGNLGLYAQRLIEEHGLAWVKQLRIDAARKGNDYKRAEILEVITKYQ